MSNPSHLDLFSGIGGFALAAKKAGFETKGFCEIDPLKLETGLTITPDLCEEMMGYPPNWTKIE